MTSVSAVVALNLHPFVAYLSVFVAVLLPRLTLNSPMVKSKKSAVLLT